MSYLLDANVFIQAKNLHYGLDFCPAFWQWLINNRAGERVFSIDKVADELIVGGDELADWARNSGKDLFLETDAATTAQFAKVSSWVTEQKYEQSAKDTFLKVADFYLVAYALANGHIVVTHEIFSDSIKKIKIPNVCKGLGLRLMTPYEMLREEKARFVL